MNKESYNQINIYSAKQNNLKNISLNIPKNKIIVFTGVSGSGKSSVVFDTIAVESQRQLNETFSSYIRNRLPKYEKPDVVSIENLSPAIIVNQKRIGSNARSTVGTFTEIYSLLRLLFSRIGIPNSGSSNHYSFNDPTGMCSECKGLGKIAMLDLNRFIDMNKSLNGGAILFPTFRIGSYYLRQHTDTDLFDLDKPVNQFSEEELKIFLYGGSKKEMQKFVESRTSHNYHNVDDFEGLVTRFNRQYLNKDLSVLNDKRTETLMNYISYCTCPQCNGKRLKKESLDTKINGYDIADYSDMEIENLTTLLSDVKDPIGTHITKIIIENLNRIINIGLGYLSLSRETSTLSGGESQRLKLVKHLGSSLSGMLYIFDEPSTGLHPKDISMLTKLFVELRNKGNTILIVEHDKDIICNADVIVDMGPLAGEKGGEVVFNGSFKDFLLTDTLTARLIRESIPLNNKNFEPKNYLSIKNASLHNLKNVSVNIPIGAMTCVTGVAGSGKSSLISKVFVEQYPESIVVNQATIATNIRSTPATYLGIMDNIRKLFALKHDVNIGLFSFNSEGACPMCKGKGKIFVEMAFMDSITTICERCEGNRFAPLILEYKLSGKSIIDILNLTVVQSIEFFKKESFVGKLELLDRVGLGYLTLGQSLDTLSGGELQRVKLANELKKSGNIYVMDEPTTGLHMADITVLMKVLKKLIKNGNTIIIIEHNLDVIKQADWVIDLGYEGGRNGGDILFEGTPLQLICCQRSITADYLRREIQTMQRGLIPVKNIEIIAEK